MNYSLFPKLLSLFCLTIILSSKAQVWEHSYYFNTEIIKSNTIISHMLEHDGFVSCDISTPDGLTLSGLYRRHPEAQYTIIFYSGGWAHKEKSASFAVILQDQPCNILFIDGRNTQRSWPFWRKLWQFSIYDYHDILGALDFCYTNNSLPIIIHGMCAGGYNSLKALLHLKEQKELEHYNIKGVILDGAWSSRLEISQRAPYATIMEQIASALHNSRHFKKLSKKNIFFNGITNLFSLWYNTTYTVLFKPWFYYQEQTTNLMNSICQLSIPMFFIHSLDDEHASFSKAQQFAQKAKDATTWWITEPSKHCCNHLKFKTEYKTKMISFIETCLRKNNHE